MPTPSQILKVSVPDLSGKTRSEAEAVLASAGLTVGTVSQPYRYEYTFNTIFTQGTAAGTQVIKGSSINISVGNGPKPYAIGDAVWFDGGYLYRNSTGPDGGVWKEDSYQNGYFYITDLPLDGRIGVRFCTGYVRYGWADLDLIHQRTN